MSLVGFTRITGGDYTLPSIDGTHADFIVLLKFADFTSGVLLKLDDGGGDLRFSSDLAGTIQLPCEVVTFDKVGGNIQVWVKIPSAFTGAVIHVWGDNTGASQPLVTDPFGRNATNSGNLLVNHFEGDPLSVVDSTGTATLTNTGVVAGTGHIGGSAVFTDGDAIDTGVNYGLGVGDFKYTTWFKTSIPSTGLYVVFGNVTVSSPWPSAWAAFIQDGKFTFWTDQSSVTSVRTTTLVNDGLWHKATMVREGNSHRMYLDGVLENTTVGTIRNVSNHARSEQYSNNGVSGFNDYIGELDESVLSLTGLDSDFILTEHQNQSAVGAWGVMGAVGGGITLTVDSGSYSVTGTSTPVLSQVGVSALSGGYSLAGTDTTIISQLNITTTSGEYVLTGSSVDLLAAKRLIAEAGTYDLTGTSVTLIYTPGGGGEVLVIDSGVYALTGDEVILKAEFVTRVDSGSYLLNGVDTPILYNPAISIDSGVYSKIGTPLNLLASYGIIAESTTYSLIGTAVTLKYSGDTAQTIGTISAAFADDKYSVKYKPTEITVTFKV